MREDNYGMLRIKNSTHLLTVLTYKCYIINRTKEEGKIRKKKRIFILLNVLTTTAKAVYIKTVRFPHRGNKVS